MQTGSQRTNGYELGVNGQRDAAWSVAGGYAYQDAFVTSATTAARRRRAGRRRCRTTRSRCGTTTRSIRACGAALGVLYRSDMFAAIDNTVTLPGYTRADAAAFFTLTRQLRLQVNVENLFDSDVLRQRRQQHEHLAGISARGAGRPDGQLLRCFKSVRLEPDTTNDADQAYMPRMRVTVATRLMATM